jgi:ribose transport system substrate-binding protein
MSRVGRGRITTLAIVAAGTVALAACSSGSSSDGPSGSTGGGVISAQTMATLRAKLAQAAAVPSFTDPGPAMNANVVRGKDALAMPVNSQIDSCNTQAQDFQALGQQLGMNVTQFPDTGVPTQWVSGLQQAVSSHDSAVTMLCGIVPEAIGPQLQAAQGAGVAVVDGNYNETSDYQGLDAETAVNTAAGIAEDVDDAILQLGGKPLHGLVVSSDSIVQGPAAVTAATQEVQSICPGTCSLTDMVVPIQNWATQLEGEVHQALAANPAINAVIIVFDGMVQFAMPAVEQIHRLGLQIYTWGASRTVESYMLQKGSLIAADPGPDNQWVAYEAMDQVIRLLSGHPAASVDAEVTPNRFWDPDNVVSFFGPGGTYGNQGYGGNSFINGFRQLWGLQPVTTSP